MKLILFDFDGVLVDTLLACFDITAEYNDNLSLEDYRSFFNGNIYNTTRLDGSPINYRNDFFEQYKIRTREKKIPEELKNALKKISSDNTLAIVSSTPKSLIEDILNRENTRLYFADILGSDLHKSKVIKIKILLEKYKVSPNDVVYVTDTVGDIKEARECGVKSIAVTWGYHEKEMLEKAEPEKVVNTADQLVATIKELQNE